MENTPQPTEEGPIEGQNQEFPFEYQYLKPDERVNYEQELILGEKPLKEPLPASADVEIEDIDEKRFLHSVVDCMHMSLDAVLKGQSTMKEAWDNICGMINDILSVLPESSTYKQKLASILDKSKAAFAGYADLEEITKDSDISLTDIEVNPHTLEMKKFKVISDFRFLLDEIETLTIEVYEDYPEMASGEGEMLSKLRAFRAFLVMLLTLLVLAAGCVFDKSGISTPSSDAGDGGQADADALVVDSGDADPPQETECDDGQDNDEDGDIDCLDEDCMDHTGPDGVICEYQNETTCDDGGDNDGDGFADCLDQDCATHTGPDGVVCEYQIETLCADGGDNDGDGLADCDDQDCATACGVEDCDDGIDNDNDNDVDCEDIDCDNTMGPGFVCEYGTESTCGDGGDNDADTFIDCADLDCDTVMGPGYVCEHSTELTCGDGGDNDADGLTDCDDPDCAASCEDCSDGIDNNGNNLVDCADPLCSGTAGCFIGGSEDCSNGIDDDSDTDIDCADSDCIGKSCGAGCFCAYGEKWETDCTDTVDNDGDGTTDCGDLECAEMPVCSGGTYEICDDGGDNNGDLLINCADSTCVFDPLCYDWNDWCATAGDICITSYSGDCHWGKCNPVSYTCMPNDINNCYPQP